MCQKEFITKYSKVKFCSRSCSAKYGAMQLRQKLLNDWLQTGKLNYSKNTMIKVNSIYREHIMKEQNNKCSLCGISNIWNDKELIFVLDHIDGDSSNHCRDNLRLICPNCDSQLDTFKFKGKHKSSRNYRTYKNK